MPRVCGVFGGGGGATRHEPAAVGPSTRGRRQRRCGCVGAGIPEQGGGQGAARGAGSGARASAAAGSGDDQARYANARRRVPSPLPARILLQARYTRRARQTNGPGRPAGCGWGRAKYARVTAPLFRRTATRPNPLPARGPGRQGSLAPPPPGRGGGGVNHSKSGGWVTEDGRGPCTAPCSPRKLSLHERLRRPGHEPGSSGCDRSFRAVAENQRSTLLKLSS